MTDPIEDILDFWFGEVNELGCSSPEHRRRWWTKADAFDEAVGSHFLGDYEHIVAGDRDAWRNTPRGTLATIIVLDQFSRNMFRGTPSMFAADELAREVCHEGLDAGFDADLSFDERLFFYLPLAHSEEMTDHRRSIELLNGLVDGAAETLAADARNYLDFAERHKAIVERFGRYPHRNATLGRASTPEEIAFLEEPGSSF
ncbi:MAG: DUF924 domain-containing protein [Deltaproteobacteria bacterium]|nr:DUF924 domain-containing protein [Deltaproteobacteria bacterium]